MFLSKTSSIPPNLNSEFEDDSVGFSEEGLLPSDDSVDNTDDYTDFDLPNQVITDSIYYDEESPDSFNVPPMFENTNSNSTFSGSFSQTPMFTDASLQSDSGVRLSLDWVTQGTMEGNVLDVSGKDVMFNINLSIDGYKDVGDIVIEVPRVLDIIVPDHTVSYYKGSLCYEADTDVIDRAKWDISCIWHPYLNDYKKPILLTNKVEYEGGVNISMPMIYEYDNAHMIESGKIGEIKVKVTTNSGVTESSLFFTVDVPFSPYFWAKDNSCPEVQYRLSSSICATKFINCFNDMFKMNIEDFDFDNYIYDIASLDVEPGYRNTQPADASVTVVIGGKGYGMGGELISLLCRKAKMGTSNSISKNAYYNFPFTYIGNSITDILNFPNWFNRGDLHNYSGNLGYNAYNIFLPFDKENSSFDYNLLLLVRYPKQSSIVRGYNSFTDKSYLYLPLSAQAEFDSYYSGTLIRDCYTVLFEGALDSLNYSGDIYSSYFIGNYKYLNDDIVGNEFHTNLIFGPRSANTSDIYADLLRNSKLGVDTDLSISLGFEALNCARARIDVTPFDLNLMLDNIVINLNGVNYLLTEDDICWKDLYFAIDDPPSEYLGDNTWLKDEQSSYIDERYDDIINISIGDTFSEDIKFGDYIYKGEYADFNEVFVNKEFTGFLNIRFSNSLYNTKGYAWGTLLLKHDGPTIRKILSDFPTGKLEGKLVPYLAYTSYDVDGNADIQCSENSISGPTASYVRQWDKSHPYRGYSDTVFPYRNFYYCLITDDKFYSNFIEYFEFHNSDSFAGSSNSKRVYRKTQAEYMFLTLQSAILTGIVDYKYLEIAALDSLRMNHILKGTRNPIAFDGVRFYIVVPNNLQYYKYGDFLPYTWNDFVQKRITSHNSSNKATGSSRISREMNRRLNNIYTFDEKKGNLASVKVDVNPVNNHSNIIRVDELVDYSRGDNPSLRTMIENNKVFGGTGLAMHGGFGFKNSSGEKYLDPGVYNIVMAAQFIDSEGNAFDLAELDGETFASVGEATGKTYLDDIITPSPDGEETFLVLEDNFIIYDDSALSFQYLNVNNAKDANIEPEAEYTYELTYGVGSGEATEVVLFDSIESSSRTEATSEWQGTIQSIDLNKTGGKLYINKSEIDVDYYRSNNADKTWLTQSKGWTLVSNPDTYNYAGVRSIAVDLTHKTFSAGNVAQIFIHMKAPVMPSNLKEGTLLTAYNESLFHDKHSSTKYAQTTLADNTTVTFGIPSKELPLQEELPETGGIGTGPHVLFGICFIYIGYILIDSRIKKRN